MANLDDLFSGNLDNKMDFLNDKKQVNADGITKLTLLRLETKKEDIVQLFVSYLILQKMARLDKQQLKK